MSDRKTAFVFAGGGSLGAIQVGMLHSLATHGVVADLVCGSSVGALNGAHYAGEPRSKESRNLKRSGAPCAGRMFSRSTGGRS